MSAICIIPARGGSKRIPRKNIKEFNGRPMISYAINCALESGIFSKVLVSTDDPEIRDVAVHFGAEVPHLRDKKLADDFATTIDVISFEVLRVFEDGHDFYTVCCLYPCTPLLTSDLLLSAMEISRENPAKYVFPVLPFPANPQHGLIYDKNTGFRPLDAENEVRRSQDFEQLYYDAGQFYFGGVELWLNKKNIHSNGMPFQIDIARGIDINTLDDWRLAEAIFASKG